MEEAEKAYQISVSKRGRKGQKPNTYYQDYQNGKSITSKWTLTDVNLSNPYTNLGSSGVG